MLAKAVTKPEAQENPDGPMSPDELAVAQSLSQDMVNKIDEELLKHCRHTSRKVAMVIGMAMGNKALHVPGLPDLFYAERIKVLVNRGSLIAEGNLDYMRFSEVKLP